MDERNLPAFLQSHANLRPGMSAAKRTSPLVTPLSKASPAIIARMLAAQNSPIRASVALGSAPSTKQPGLAPSPPYDGVAQGVAARAARVGILSDSARARYEQGVSVLDTTDSAGGAALKAEARAITPPEILAPLQAWRRGLGAVAGSGGRANVSNAGVNNVARFLGKFGRGAGVVGTLVALDDILTSRDHMRGLTANIGAGLGGFVGGAGGATAGAATGPAAPVLAPAGGLAGSIAGGRLGYKAGEDAYDFFANW